MANHFLALILSSLILLSAISLSKKHELKAEKSKEMTKNKTIQMKTHQFCIRREEYKKSLIDRLEQKKERAIKLVEH